MAIFLHALSLKHYRGIGSEMQKLRDFREFNFFIGANNAGKSTVLNFISKYLPYRKDNEVGNNKFDPLEWHRGVKTGPIDAAIGIPHEKFMEGLRSRYTELPAPYWPMLTHIVRALCDEGVVWVQPANQQKGVKLAQDRSVESAVGDGEWNQVWRSITHQSGGALTQNWIPETVRELLSAQSLELPTTQLIPAKRQIGQTGAILSDLSGNGLIDRLAEVQSPDHDKRADRLLFDKINLFLQSITGRADAVIEVPHNRQHVLVHMDNKVLPLSSLGSGIQEVVMLASFCTLFDEQIICMEEPEIHLHPILQRKLVKYLKAYTDNQYFIATHSASFIDTPEAAVFHVTNNGDQTKISESILRSERYQICADLGYKASDIVQSNAVIWVEGPSDRIYLNHWIKIGQGDKEPELVEGIHYTIMFYGGRLLSHLSAEADEVDEFIALRSLNRNIALVMDSDKSSARDVVNDTKLRLQEGFEAGGGLCWITIGREIENYVDHQILQAAVAEVYGDAYDKPHLGGQFDHALHFWRAKPKKSRKKDTAYTDLLETNVDKVKVARTVCVGKVDSATSNLRGKVAAMRAFIRSANDI